jgi:cytochrome b6-f complex iron-sulfur subunit/menaquinol-cytochrome c reductase iron-sulfur subunit
MERRRFLTLVRAGSAAVAAGAACGPGLRALVGSARGGGGERWVRALPFASLRDGEPTRVTLVAAAHDAWTHTPDAELGAVWLERRGETVVAFSAVCPHLGCGIVRRGDAFACLCHRSSFARADGAAQGGPAPRGLDPLVTRVEGGDVWVAFKRYRAGIANRIEVG